MKLTEHVAGVLEARQPSLQGETIIVAVSGGVDSLVLLHVLHQLQPRFGYKLHVVTFDHQLRGAASRADADYVRDMASRLGLPISAGSADVAGLSRSGRLSIELAARQARYTYLAEVALALGARLLAVGHHRDDQVETVLMHLLRGTGLAGLRGMLPEAPLSEQHLQPSVDDEVLDAVEEMTVLRPLLDLSREEISTYAAAQGLEAREDATNADTRLLRNQIRHELLPMLESLQPGIRETLARTAQIIQGDYQIVQHVVDAAISRLVDWELTASGEEIAHVDRAAFLRELNGVQRQVLRRIISDLTGSGDLSYQQVESVCALIRDGQTGQQLSLPTALVISIGYDEFTFHDAGQAMPYPRHLPYLPPGRVIPLGLDGQGYMTDYLRLYTYWAIEGRTQEIYRANPLEAALAIEPDAELSLRTRRPGDRFQPMGMGGRSQKLADLFINLKVPQGLRDRVPLLTVNEQIAWFVAPTAGGLQGRIAEPFAVRPASESVLRLRWEILEAEVVD